MKNVLLLLAAVVADAAFVGNLASGGLAGVLQEVKQDVLSGETKGTDFLPPPPTLNTTAADTKNNKASTLSSTSSTSRLTTASTLTVKRNLYRDVSWRNEFYDDFSVSGTGWKTNWEAQLGQKYAKVPNAPMNWGTGEVEWMTGDSKNVYNSNSKLFIVPVATVKSSTFTNWTSARIESKNKFWCGAGELLKIEARITLPRLTTTGKTQDGIWPAFWALGATYRLNANNWPGCGELDIMENVNGRTSIIQALHCGTNGGGPCNEFTGLGGTSPTAITRGTAYNYAVVVDRVPSDYRQQSISYYINGVLQYQIYGNQIGLTHWTPLVTNNYHVILNVAVGGILPDIFLSPTKTPTSKTVSGLEARMEVDWVRVDWQNRYAF